MFHISGDALLDQVCLITSVDTLTLLIPVVFSPAVTTTWSIWEEERRELNIILQLPRDQGNGLCFVTDKGALKIDRLSFITHPNSPFVLVTASHFPFEVMFTPGNVSHPKKLHHGRACYPSVLRISGHYIQKQNRVYEKDWHF